MEPQLMSSNLKKTLIALIACLATSSCENAPRSYPQCILKHTKSGMSDLAVREIKKACATEFPESKAALDAEQEKAHEKAIMDAQEAADAAAAAADAAVMADMTGNQPSPRSRQPAISPQK